MTVPVADRCLAAAGRLATGASGMVGGPRLSILILHRVLPEPDPIFPAELDARRFERLMAMVARTFRVLPLHRAASMLADGSLPSRALSITFDDGYADNCSIATPILAREGLEATFFVATSFIDGGRMWNDTAIECLRRTTASSVDLGDFGLGRMPTGSARERRQAIEKVLPIVKYQVPAERAKSLERLHALCGHPALPDDLMMSTGQLRALRRAGMTVGAHTVNHPILRTLPDDVAEAEIADSRSWLEAQLDAPVRLFAYPNGRPDVDFDDRHAAMVRRLGFDAAVSTQQGPARPGDNPFKLRRYTPWEVSVPRWTARLVQSHLRG